MGILQVVLKNGELKVTLYDEEGNKVREEKHDKIMYIIAEDVLLSDGKFLVHNVKDFKVYVKGNMATVVVVRE